MTMEHPPFEDVFPIENGHFPKCHISFQGGNISFASCLFERHMTTKNKLTRSPASPIVPKFDPLNSSCLETWHDFFLEELRKMKRCEDFLFKNVRNTK